MYIIIIFLLQLLHHTDTVVHVFKLIFKSVFIQVSFKSFIFYMSTFTFYILTSASFCNTSSLPFLILHTNDSHLKKKKGFSIGDYCTIGVSWHRKHTVCCCGLSFMKLEIKFKLLLS